MGYVRSVLGLLVVLAAIAALACGGTKANNTPGPDTSGDGDDDFTGGDDMIDEAKLIPEPTTGSLLALGLAVLGCLRRGSRRASAR